MRTTPARCGALVMAAAGAASLTLALAPGAASAATSATPDHAKAAAHTAAAGRSVKTTRAAWSCPSGDVCFYTGTDGTGSRCNWDVADPDWTSGSITCSWATTQPARSVWNNGQSTAYPAVYFYTGTNYTSYNGCMGRGWHGNIGPVFLRSHKWVTGSCPP